jgi:peroxiredoxin Q/BCP
MQAYRDRYADLGPAKAQVVGISGDDVATLTKFKASLKLPFDLVSDPDGAVAKQYGARQEGSDYDDRRTVVIDQNGVVRDFIDGMKAIDPGASIDGACSLDSAASQPL